MLQLGRECVILDMKATSKDEALHELATTVHSLCARIDVDVLLRVLREREQVGSTGVGNGIAIPHAKVPGLDQLMLCFGRSKGGVSFEAIDNHPVHLFVQIISPLGMADEYLQSLAKISRLLKKEENRRALLEAKTEQDVIDLFKSSEG